MGEEQEAAGRREEWGSSGPLTARRLEVREQQEREEGERKGNQSVTIQ